MKKLEPEKIRSEHKSEPLERFEDILLKFENSWFEFNQDHNLQAADLPSVQAFVDQAVDAPQSLSFELFKIDLEHRLRNGFPVISDEYLSQVDQSDPDIRTDILSYEFQIRKKFNVPPTEHEIRSRFGDAAIEVSQLNDQVVTEPAEGTRNNADEESVVERENVVTLLKPGTEFHQYRIQKQIGSGAFALIFLATDTRLNRNVAVKFLRPHFSRDKNLRRRMLREAQALATLQHSNIVSIIETGQFHGLDYIVTQFVNGVDLATHRRTTQYSIESAIGLVAKLAHAVEHAHGQGVVHRDIKPANVMIDDCGTPMLLDFGLAQLADLHNDAPKADAYLTQIGDVVGTPAFMPPEHASGKAWKADPRGDIYSLGVLLFELVCNRLPFEGSSAEVIHKLVHQLPPDPKKIDTRIGRDLQTIILKCLEKEPYDRYQTSATLALDLENVLAGKPIAAQPTGLVRRTVKWARRKPVLAGLAATLLVTTSFAIGIATQLNRVSGERDRAQNAEMTARAAEAKLATLLASEAAVAGELAMQRGQLHRAIEFFDRSISGVSVGSLQTRLKKIDALVATRQTKQACDELDSILNEENAPSFRSQLQMWKAELALDGYASYGDPVELFRESLASSISESGASVDYLSAMLATNSVDALSGFRRTLERNQFHHRARRMLIIMLISLGRVAEAELEVAIAQELFPESEDFRLFEAMVLAYRGELDRANEALVSVPSVDQAQWKEFCQLIDRTANDLVISPDLPGYRVNSVREVAHQFSSECLPLLKNRGWHFPPLIGESLAELPVLLTDSRNDSKLPNVVASLKRIVDVHPEGSLNSAYIESLASLQNSTWAENEKNLAAPGPETAKAGLVAIDRARKLPSFVVSTQDGNPGLEFGYAVSLVLVFKEDVERYKERMRSAASRMDPDSLKAATSLRAMTIGLINIGAYEEAIRFADSWILTVGKDDFEAVWHRLMCDWKASKYLEMIKMYHEFKPFFPNNERMKNLVGSAKGKIEQMLDPIGE